MGAGIAITGAAILNLHNLAKFQLQQLAVSPASKSHRSPHVCLPATVRAHSSLRLFFCIILPLRPELGFNFGARTQGGDTRAEHHSPPAL